MMLVLAKILFVAGLTGLVWSTVGCSLVAFILGSLRPLRRSATQVEFPLKLELLVVAHNEEQIITRTLQSLADSVVALEARAGKIVEAKVLVGLDHCTDATAERIAEFAAKSTLPVTVVENGGPQGKWQNLLNVIGSSQAEWVALVDSGSIWDASLLVHAVERMRMPNVLAVAPSYAPIGAGLLERANWLLERSLKSLENRSGGPISVHGATVLYQRGALLAALDTLAGRTWLNDDVAIPLALRLKHPEGRIVYLTGGENGALVSDAGVRSELDVEFRRRRRMILGNLQWVRGILIPRFFSSVWVSMVASRRVFRLLWAYWVLFMLLGGVLAFFSLRVFPASATPTGYEAYWLVSGAVLGLLVLGQAVFSSWVRRLSMAFLSGLQIPRYWSQVSADKGIKWV